MRTTSTPAGTRDGAARKRFLLAAAEMGAAMVVPVLIWLPLRRYPARHTADLAGAFVLTTLTGILIASTGLAGIGTTIPRPTHPHASGLAGTLAVRWRSLGRA